MRFSILSSALVFATTLLSSTSALQAIVGSPCESKCGNVLDETNGVDDISCYDRDFGLTTKANVFQSCITCQLSSKYVDPRTRQTDLQWGLYNLRYAVSWCLFGYPNNTDHGSNPCITSTACGTLENAFEFDSLSPNATAYGYCALMHENILPKCTACVTQSDEKFVTNYITALIAACKQQPVLGATISIEGSLFSKIRANITDPNAAATSFHKQAAGGLPLGAKVGIAIGTIALVLTTLGCCIVWRGKKRRRAVLARRREEPAYAEWVAQQVTQRSPHPGGMGFPPHSAGGFFQDSPQSAMSQQPLFPHQGWGRGNGKIEDETSPASNHGEKNFFSPYSSNYTSPISATEQVHVASREWPTERQTSFGGSVTRPPVRTGSVSFEQQGDRIEMQNVAPVLLHPGHGRRSGDA